MDGTQLPSIMYALQYNQILPTQDVNEKLITLQNWLTQTCGYRCRSLFMIEEQEDTTKSCLKLDVVFERIEDGLKFKAEML